MKAELIYVTDVYCLWCYGFAATVHRIANDYADTIDLRLVNGGMIPEDMPLKTFFGRFPDPVGLHKRVTQTSQQQFGAAYLDQIRNLSSSQRNLNFFIPARAMAAFKILGVSDCLKLASELQQAHYEMGQDLSDPETYRDMECAKSVDFARFKTLFADSATLKAAVEDFQWVNLIGIGGFPALILKRTESECVMIARGYMPYDAVKSALDSALASVLDGERNTGPTCQLDGTACS